MCNALRTTSISNLVFDIFHWPGIVPDMITNNVRTLLISSAVTKEISIYLTIGLK